jgi:hypothetical protein
MLRIDKAIKPWRDAAALADHINLYGFWNDTAFLTKTGDLGMVLRVTGVDYESVDHAQQEYARLVSRLCLQTGNTCTRHHENEQAWPYRSPRVVDAL